jgi:Flp pilus assembly pilin Flp
VDPNARTERGEAERFVPEYALLAGMIALAVLASFLVLGTEITTALNGVARQLGAAS